MSLTNRAILELLTPERQEELLQLLLSRRKYFVVVKETPDFNGIFGIYISIDDARNIIVNNAFRNCGNLVIDSKIFKERVSSMIDEYGYYSTYSHKWRIYEFPIQSQEIENK